MAVPPGAKRPKPSRPSRLRDISIAQIWPEERVIVELDGYQFHGHRAAFERDHRRDVVHRDAGYEVLRFTASQLEEAPIYVAAVIARALDRRSASRTHG